VTEKGFGVAGDNLLPSVPLILQRTGLQSLEKGTLNLTLPAPYIVRADARLTGHEYVTGEAIKFQRCVVLGLRALIMRPETHETIPGYGHGPAHIELMSPHNLTRTLGLSPGMILDLEVDGDDEWWASAR
jgi:CTP-dependent riboflavin kinase